MQVEPSSSQTAAPELNSIDRHFAAFIGGISGDRPEVKAAAALVSYARSLGHICLDLRALDELPLPKDELAAIAGGSLPRVADWNQALRKCEAVGSPGQYRPLVLDNESRLYLYRYWKYEHDLAAALKACANDAPSALDRNLVRKGLARLFPNLTSEPDWQLVAVFAALRRRLCVISGGPGTGKTRTVVVLLALMLEQAPELRIALAAPTGKAAARLQDAVKDARKTLDCPATIKDKLPQEASTLHRLLGTIPDSTRFRHHAENPLAYDVIVVDEASMVDLALMAKLAAALPKNARLILVGDKDQLASVQPGAALADICGPREARGYSKEFSAELSDLASVRLQATRTKTEGTSLADCIVELRKNYRFGERSGIYKLSNAVNHADTSGALEILSQATAGTFTDISSSPIPEPGALPERLTRLVQDHFASYFAEKDPVEALRRLNQFKILSALRNGVYGVENLNRLVEQLLRKAGRISGGAFYHGRPVMITRNDYNLKLFNGDIGIVLSDPHTGELRAWFSTADGTVRSYLPLRLPEHETAYALTVHKSQGSEFARVLLILPKEDSPVLTRELVYTGLTRASKHVEVWYDPPLLRTAIQRKTSRRSGLRDALWG